MKLNTVLFSALSLISFINATPIPADLDLKATSTAIPSSTSSVVPNFNEQISFNKRSDVKSDEAMKKIRRSINHSRGYSVDKISPRDDHHGSNVKR